MPTAQTADATGGQQRQLRRLIVHDPDRRSCYTVLEGGVGGKTSKKDNKDGVRGRCGASLSGEKAHDNKGETWGGRGGCSFQQSMLMMRGVDSVDEGGRLRKSRGGEGGGKDDGGEVFGHRRVTALASRGMPVCKDEENM